MERKGPRSKAHSRERRHSRHFTERLVETALFACAFLSILTTLAILSVLLLESLEFFRSVSLWDFLGETEWTPLFSEQRFGIWPLLSGTFLVTGIAMLVALPSGLLISLYLSEYAPDGVRLVVKPVLEVLSGIPTVVYGYFALLLVTPWLQSWIPNLSAFNALAPGLVMGLMILPLVSSLSQESLQAVPRSLREGAYALGSTKLQVSLRIVLPAASAGIMASFVLAMVRAVGETMIVTIAAGQQPRLSLNPLQPIETMTAYVVQVSLGDVPAGTLEYRTIFVVGAVLFLMTFCLNLVSQHLTRRLREAYR